MHKVLGLIPSIEKGGRGEEEEETKEKEEKKKGKRQGGGRGGEEGRWEEEITQFHLLSFAISNNLMKITYLNREPGIKIQTQPKKIERP